MVCWSNLSPRVSVERQSHKHPGQWDTSTFVGPNCSIDTAIELGISWGVVERSHQTSFLVPGAGVIVIHDPDLVHIACDGGHIKVLISIAACAHSDT